MERGTAETMLTVVHFLAPPDVIFSVIGTSWAVGAVMILVGALLLLLCKLWYGLV